MVDNPERFSSLSLRDIPGPLHYAALAWRRKWMIGVLCVLTVGTTWAIVRRIPYTYEATTALLIPKEGGGGMFPAVFSSLVTGGGGSGASGGGGGGGGGGMQFGGLSIPSLTPNRDVVISILKSRSLARGLVERFKLTERFHVADTEDAVITLQRKADISVSKEGVVAITVTDADPNLAAQLANYHVKELDHLVGLFGFVESRREREFVGQQLGLAKRNLAAAEDALQRFQQRNRAVVLQEQTKEAISAAGRLKGEITAYEVKLQVMRDFATEGNTDVITARRQIEEMKRQLGKMQYGDSLSGDGVRRASRDPDGYIPFVKFPEMGLELIRLTREVKIHETLMSLLTQQQEQSRIAEAKDPPLVRVLDEALPPRHPVGPKKMRILLMAGAAAFVVGVVLALVLEHVGPPPAPRRA